MSKDNNQHKQKQNNKIGILVLLVVILIALITVLGLLLINNKAKEDEKTLAYTDLIKELSYGNVEKIEMTTGSTSVKIKMKNGLIVIIRNI